MNAIKIAVMVEVENGDIHQALLTTEMEKDVLSLLSKDSAIKVFSEKLEYLVLLNQEEQK